MQKTILVVDDDESNRLTLERLLGREGFDVTYAPTGREALEALRARPVDLVLTDLKMPGMTGIDLLKAARTVDPDVEVVVMTAYSDADEHQRALDLGATAVLFKPFDEQLFISTVRSALAAR